jgi:hypothetical protein
MFPETSWCKDFVKASGLSVKVRAMPVPLPGRARCAAFMRISRFDGMLGTAGGFVLVVLATVIAVMARDASHPVLGLVELSAAVAIVALASTLAATLFTAGMGWACYAGFLVGRHGVLALDRETLIGVVALLAVALVFTLVGAVGRALLAYRVLPGEEKTAVWR